jgi:hypothetical protein
MEVVFVVGNGLVTISGTGYPIISPPKRLNIIELLAL